MYIRNIFMIKSVVLCRLEFHIIQLYDFIVLICITKPSGLQKKMILANIFVVLLTGFALTGKVN